MEMIGWGAGVIHGERDHLIVFISGFGRPGQQTFHFLEYAEPFPQTKLFLRDHANCQYEQGILDVTSNEEENLAFLEDFIFDIGPKRITFVSGSVGTHPTVIWGHRLGVNDIHLIGPVTDYGLGLSSVRSLHPDFIQMTEFANQKVSQGYPYQSLRPFMQEHAHAVDCVDIYFGREDPIDTQHAAVIQDLQNVRSTIYHQGDHFKVPLFVQRRDTYMTDRIMAPVDRPADLRRAGQSGPIGLGYADVRLL